MLIFGSCLKPKALGTSEPADSLGDGSGRYRRFQSPEHSLRPRHATSRSSARPTTVRRYVVIGRNATGEWLQLLCPSLRANVAGCRLALSMLSGNLLQTCRWSRLKRERSRSQVDTDAAPCRVAPARPVLAGQLAIPVWDEGSGTYSIYAVNADGSNLRKVVENASSPALSPDGTQLAYRDWERDNRGIVVANCRRQRGRPA